MQRGIRECEKPRKSERALKDIVDKYCGINPIFARWLEIYVPEALTVFSLPKDLRVKMRTSNMIEHAVNYQKTQNAKGQTFSNEDSLVRMFTGLVIRIEAA